MINWVSQRWNQRDLPRPLAGVALPLAMVASRTGVRRERGPVEVVGAALEAENGERDDLGQTDECAMKAHRPQGLNGGAEISDSCTQLGWRSESGETSFPT
jgi:hypothetical protein